MTDKEMDISSAEEVSKDINNPQQYEVLEQEATEFRKGADSLKFDTSRGFKGKSEPEPKDDSEYENKERVIVDEDNHIVKKQKLKQKRGKYNPLPMNKSSSVVVDPGKQRYAGVYFPSGTSFSKRIRRMQLLNNPLFNWLKNEQRGYGFTRMQRNSLGGGLRSDRCRMYIYRKNKKLLAAVLRALSEKEEKQKKQKLHELIRNELKRQRQQQNAQKIMHQSQINQMTRSRI